VIVLLLDRKGDSGEMPEELEVTAVVEIEEIEDSIVTEDQEEMVVNRKEDDHK